jgi:uncharacterized membrane protein YoaK (UPF0700 family)
LPINYSRRLTGHVRDKALNRHLGYMLAFVAGAVNAGGFLAVQQYTSHMTGIVSTMAENVALGLFRPAAVGLAALLSFLCGAATCAVMVNYARRHDMKSIYAMPLFLEAALLLGFGLVGGQLSHFNGSVLSVTVMLLCFIMGLQNATITKVSGAEIRTTHITGLATDIGVELGKLAYGIVGSRSSPDRERLTVLVSLASAFFIGGLAGALGFKYLGYVATVPLAVVLLLLALAPIVDDLTVFFARMRR